MSEAPSPINRGDALLLQRVRLGDPSAWTTLVDKHMGRLLAFARLRLPASADAEDVVQEALVSFVTSLPDYREQASLETWLFLLLRRRIADWRRARRLPAISLDAGDDEDDLPPDPPAAVGKISGRLRQSESLVELEAHLGDALADLLASLKDEGKLRELRLAELLLLAAWGNQDAAEAVGLTPNHVGVLKHRWMTRLREHVTHDASTDKAPLDVPAVLAEDGAAERLIRRVWERRRLTCPKRSTLGAWVLSTLDAAWAEHVAFHLDVVKCPFCCASVADLRQGEAQSEPLRQRVMQSTVGFWRAEV